jgi:hypothetical protein
MTKANRCPGLGALTWSSVTRRQPVGQHAAPVRLLQAVAVRLDRVLEAPGVEHAADRPVPVDRRLAQVRRLVDELA